MGSEAGLDVLPGANRMGEVGNFVGRNQPTGILLSSFGRS
jgi:hypothetical protein